MTKVKQSFFLKVLAFFLCSVTLFGFFCGALCTVIMLDKNLYTEPYDSVLKEKLQDIAFEYAWEIGLSSADYIVYDGGTVYSEGHAQMSLVPYLEELYPSVYFEVALPDGTVMLSNYSGENFRFQVECNDRVSVKNETGKTVISSDGEIYYDTAASEEDAVEPDSSAPYDNSDTVAGSDYFEETKTYDKNNKPEETDSSYFESGETSEEAETTSFSSENGELHKQNYVETTDPLLSDKAYYGDNREILTEIRTTVYVKDTFSTFDKMYFTEKLIGILYNVRFLCPVLTVVLFFVSLLLLIFLLCSAGHRKPHKKIQKDIAEENGPERATLSTFDKLPFDVITAVLIALVCLGVLFFTEFITYCSASMAIVLSCAVLYVGILLLLSYLCTFAVRCKTSTLWKNTLIYKILRFFFRILKKVFRFFAKIIVGLPLIFKTLLCIGVILVAELLTVFLCILWSASYGWLLLWWIIEKALLVPAVLYVAIEMKKLKEGCREISSGNLSYKIDVSGMPHELKEHGHNLNNISDGLAAAVEEKLKSERLKTELITNVSHDLKTPLTSIINYVDLLQKEEPENEKSKEYLSVLERQSARLKKLLSDLVEASKASTGNIPVDLTVIDGSVLLGQVLGEYETRISDAGLYLILTKPEYPLSFIGDGNLMWRVLDNLMNNICKYAQKGTRVYVNLEDCGDSVKMIFKNISKNQLNISEDELMERFVRADSSRSTEGSGLGLSIAKSLSSLQGGNLSLSVDGDLFKATVEMKKA